MNDAMCVLVRRSEFKEFRLESCLCARPYAWRYLASSSAHFHYRYASVTKCATAWAMKASFVGSWTQLGKRAFVFLLRVLNIGILENQPGMLALHFVSSKAGRPRHILAWEHSWVLPGKFTFLLDAIFVLSKTM